MMKIALFIILALPANAAKVGITQIAAGTTVALNLLDIHSTIKKAKVVGSKVKTVTVKAVKKVKGK